MKIRGKSKCQPHDFQICGIGRPTSLGFVNHIKLLYEFNNNKKIVVLLCDRLEVSFRFVITGTLHRTMLINWYTSRTETPVWRSGVLLPRYCPWLGAINESLSEVQDSIVNRLLRQPSHINCSASFSKETRKRSERDRDYVRMLLADISNTRSNRNRSYGH